MVMSFGLHIPFYTFHDNEWSKYDKILIWQSSATETKLSNRLHTPSITFTNPPTSKRMYLADGREALIIFRRNAKRTGNISRGTY